MKFLFQNYYLFYILYIIYYILHINICHALLLRNLKLLNLIKILLTTIMKNNNN